MKLPLSQMSSKDLESLFQKSSIMENNFFPKTVPEAPLFSEAENSMEEKAGKEEKTDRTFIKEE